MSQIRPFQALRPEPSRAAQVAAVPYDVVNRAEAAALAQGNPWSFLHISRSEIDLPEATDPYAAEVYALAQQNFKKLIEKGPLLTEDSPSLYVYRLRAGDGHEQTGIVGTFSIDEYDRDQIKKHERTRQDKEDDRTRHLLALKAQTGPVFLTYKGREEINSFVAQTIREQKPLYDFKAVDGITHTIWRVSNPQDWVSAFQKIDTLYIADGHHRAASASRARKELASKNPKHTGKEDYNFVLAVAFPAEQLRILPYNRAIKDLRGMTEKDFLQAISKDFEVREGASATPAQGQFSMYLGGKWWGLKPKAKATGLITALDVSVLQDRLLGPVLGIQDPRTDKRIDFVGGIRGTQELEKLVKEGKAAVAFSLYPTTLGELMGVSDANEIMPPKSTWFEPKLRDGLLSHWIDNRFA